jgi:hypothetical protein
MLDLYNQKYGREDLKKYIYAVKLVDIVKTQTLDVTFVVRYILNKNYQLTIEDEKITLDFVLQYQPHLKQNEILAHLYMYTSDDDSVEDFESVSSR